MWHKPLDKKSEKQKCKNMKGVLMHLNSFRENRREGKRGAGYDTKRCKAKEVMYWADGGVLSGVQRPAEKDLLDRGKDEEMEREVDIGEGLNSKGRLWESYRPWN